MAVSKTKPYRARENHLRGNPGGGWARCWDADLRDLAVSNLVGSLAELQRRQTSRSHEMVEREGARAETVPSLARVPTLLENQKLPVENFPDLQCYEHLLKS
jgi:hypothetical protein